MMSRGIARRIAFRFDDPSAEPPLRQIMDDDLADQKSGQFQRVAGKFFSSEAAKFEVRACHGLRRTNIGRLVVIQPREFRMVDHDSGIHLNRIKIFFLKRIARFRRSEHLARQREGCSNVFGSNRIFSRKRFIQPDNELGNIVQPAELLVVNHQSKKFSHRDFAVDSLVVTPLHIQQRFVNTQQRQP
jgi:hypothetical protein